jgi:hypothetical protein
MGKGGDGQKGKSDKIEGHGIQCTANGSTTPIVPRNVENATRRGDERTRREEARGRSRSIHGAGEERRGKRRYPIRGRSGLHTVPGNGQPAQDFVRVSDMDGKRNLSALGDQQLAYMNPFRGGCLPIGRPD